MSGVPGRGGPGVEPQRSPRAPLPEHGPRRTAFSLVVLLTLGLFAAVGVVLVRPELVTGLLGHDTAGHIALHFRIPDHRVHDLTFGFLFATAGSGMLAQARAPSRNVAGQLMALIPWIALLLAFVLSSSRLPFAPAPIFGGLTLIATILHPSVRDLPASFGLSRVDRAMLALVLIAAVPLLALASTNIGLQRTVTSDHAALGHYGFMAAFGFTVVGAGLLASLRPEGWRLPAWVAGLLPALLGLASLAYPDVDSSLGPFRALGAIAWGSAFVAASELGRPSVPSP